MIALMGRRSVLFGALALLVTWGSMARPAWGDRRCRAISMTLEMAQAQGLSTQTLRRLKAIHCRQRQASRATAHAAGAIRLFGRTDQCSGDVELTLGPQTSCASLPPRAPSWSLRMGGRCIDSQDMTLRQACYRFSGGTTSAHAVKVYRSDQCQGSLIAMLGPETDCLALKRRGTDAFAIELNGTCINITDTSLQRACLTYRGAGSPGAQVRLYGSDSCQQSQLQSIVGADVSCDQFRGVRQQTRAIKVGQRCIDVQDMPVRRACSLHHGLTTPSQKVEIYKSDSCGRTDLKAIIGPNTRCRWLPPRQQVAWAIKAGGRCINISDTTLRRACRQYKYAAWR